MESKHRDVTEGRSILLSHLGKHVSVMNIFTLRGLFSNAEMKPPKSKCLLWCNGTFLLSNKSPGGKL